MTDLISREDAVRVGADIAERSRPDGFPHEASMAYHSGAMDVIDAIRALPSVQPVEPAAIRAAIRPILIAERLKWWTPEYPGQKAPILAVWWRDEPEEGLSGFDTAHDRDAFRAGEAGPFIRRVTGNDFPQLPFSEKDTK